MRVGVLGGTFDPVHLAHLVIAEQCREQARLDQVLFVLAPRPPHKLDRPLTPYHHRQEMLELAIAGYPAFQVSTVEKDRPGPSYTVETLRELKTAQPDVDFHLILGSDSVADLPTWHQPEAIAQLASLIIVSRPGSEASTPPAYFRWQAVTMPLLEISSTDLRTRLAQKRSIRYLTPRAVECYIQTHHLYATP